MPSRTPREDPAELFVKTEKRQDLRVTEEGLQLL
jgi:hypothetical protein